jgi:hypothetical protein
LSGHCYDSYVGTAEVDKWVADYNKIKLAFPNCTYIVAGSHRDSYHTAAQYAILKDLGAPSNVDSIINFSSPEWILVGRPGLGAGNAYGWAFQNYSTNPDYVAHLNFGLPAFGNNDSLNFDGVNDYIELASFTKPTTAMTCEAWIKPTKATISGQQRGGAISSTSSMYLGIIDSVDGGNTFAMHWAVQTSNSRLYNWNGNIPNNAWSHLVGTYDGSTSRAYLNGTQIDSWAQTGTITDGTYVVGTYGGGLTDGVHNFKGLISKANIYNRALSATEVAQNFNAQRSRFGI